MSQKVNALPSVTSDFILAYRNQCTGGIFVCFSPPIVMTVCFHPVIVPQLHQKSTLNSLPQR